MAVPSIGLAEHTTAGTFRGTMHMFLVAESQKAFASLTGMIRTKPYHAKLRSCNVNIKTIHTQHDLLASVALQFFL